MKWYYKWNLILITVINWVSKIIFKGKCGGSSGGSGGGKTCNGSPLPSGCKNCKAFKKGKC